MISSCNNGGALYGCDGNISNNIIVANNAFWHNIVGNFGGGATSGFGDFLANPLFTAEGFWHTNDTPDQSDDFWIDGEYHIKSKKGRWDPNNRIWVNDDAISPCIDAGDPDSDWTKELWPNGKRANLGAYGNTPQASMSLSEVGSASDLNLNGRIDYNDMELFTDKWLFDNLLLAEDLNRNGVVDFTDFAIDTTPPTPNPMQWAADGEPKEVKLGPGPFDFFATMSAAEATDDSGFVEYLFEYTTEHRFSSGWQIDRIYSVQVGRANQRHRFRVKARDLFGNETGWSTELPALP